jgi:hypothetical protein
MTKNEIIAKLEEKNVEFDASAKKAELEELLNSLTEEKKEKGKPIYSGIKLINGFYVVKGKKFSNVHEAAIFNGNN